jgi:hypothetical protein
MATATDKDEHFAFAVIDFLGAAWGLGSLAYTSFLLASRLKKLPKSAICYLDTFPDKRKQFRLVLLCAKAFGAFTLICSLPMALSPVLFSQTNMGGMVMLASISSTVPVIFAIACLCIKHHWPSQMDAAATTGSEEQGLHQLQIRTIVGQCTGSMVDLGRRPCERGVSLEFLRQFVAEFEIDENEKTWQVCSRLNKPHTEKLRCCYYGLLAAGKDRYGEPWASKQNIFVSHSWGCNFRHMVATLENFEENENDSGICGSTHYFYIDIFALNQWEFTDLKPELPLRPPTGTDSSAREKFRRQDSKYSSRDLQRLSDSQGADSTSPSYPIHFASGSGSESATGSGSGSGGGTENDSFYDIPSQTETFPMFMLRTLDESVLFSSVLLCCTDRWDQPAPLSRIW